MLSLAEPRRARRPNLTPMIDVVFLLLVFFMLASRFGADRTLPLATGTGAATATPAVLRLVELDAGGGLRLNGRPITAPELAPALTALSPDPAVPVVLRGKGAALQALVTVLDDLEAAGFSRLVLVE